MKKFFISSALLISVATLFAQSERSPFRRGYLRMGLNSIPGQLNNASSPKANILNSKFGAGPGLAFEMGKVYYFNKPQAGDLIGYGLDWTVFSLTYNPLKHWTDYENSAGQPGATDKPLIASLSTKLGPVISFNPVEKLIIDARLQLMASAQHFKYSYETSNGGFEIENGVENNEEKKTLDHVIFGFKPNIGITARRGIIGLSLDYATGKSEMNYSEYAITGQDYNYSYGKQKINNNNLQLKLTLLF